MENDGNLLIRLENVTKNYHALSPVYAVSEVDLKIRRGEFVAIMGPSGSGKSTLLNLLCGLDVQSSGKIIFDGTEISGLSDDELTRLRREKIGMIFQTFNLLPTLNALENVSLPLRLQGQSGRTANEKALKMIARVGLENRATHRPDELSGGERQRVAIARALILNPSLLLADEPTGNLDSKTGSEVLEMLAGLHRQSDMTIILVTHDVQAAAYCERRVILKDGHIVSDELDQDSSDKAETERI